MRNWPYKIMWYYIQPYVSFVALLVVLAVVGRWMFRTRGKGCGSGCSLGCFGVIAVLLLSASISSFFSSKILHVSDSRCWYMETCDIDGELFYNVKTSSWEGLGTDGNEPWYCNVGFQGGTAAWKNYPTELYLRQKSGALHYFNFETETVRDLGNVPIPGPSQPVEEFFREL